MHAHGHTHTDTHAADRLQYLDHEEVCSYLLLHNDVYRLNWLIPIRTYRVSVILCQSSLDLPIRQCANIADVGDSCVVHNISLSLL